MTAERDSYAFVVLFRGPDAEAAQHILRTATNPQSPSEVRVCVPEVRGLDFLSAAGPAGAGLDAWWQRNVQPNTLPMFLVMDEVGLEDWIPGTDGAWFVGVGDPGREAMLAALAEPVFPVVCRDPQVVTEQAMQALGGRDAQKPLFHPGYPYSRAPVSWPRAVPRLAVVAVAAPTVPSRFDLPANPPEPEAVLPVPPAPYRPISYDPAPVKAPPPLGPPVAPIPGAGPGPGLVDRLRAGAHRLSRAVKSSARPPATPPPRLGAVVNANRPILAGFASRKGGVGKTTHAAAVAATIGEAFDGTPDTAALVDGNITNPDSWALNPPPDSATVRTLVSRLTLGQDPPPEQYARTPRLAIYPESRESEEVYTHAEVDAVAEYLRRRHSFVAVDLPNALPSLSTGGAGAVAAAWLAHCDVIVLPFNADPRARTGLLEYVRAVREDSILALVPILAPYIVSANRAIALDPAVQADIAALKRDGVEVVSVPDDENAMLALLRDLPINQASPGLRRAYIELSERLVNAVVTARRKA